MEIIKIDVLNIINDQKFIENLKNFTKLKCFYVTKDCKLEKNQIVEFMTNLYNLKSLWLIDIKFEKDLKLRKIDKSDIYKLFPDVCITKKEILWYKRNINFNKISNLVNKFNKIEI